MHSSAIPYLKALGTRLLAGIPVLLLVTFLATALSDLMPGSAAQAILGEFASPERLPSSTLPTAMTCRPGSGT